MLIEQNGILGIELLYCLRKCWNTQQTQRKSMSKIFVHQYAIQEKFEKRQTNKNVCQDISRPKNPQYSFLENAC
jgi:hypothetical protein